LQAELEKSVMSAQMLGESRRVEGRAGGGVERERGRGARELEKERWGMENWGGGVRVIGAGVGQYMRDRGGAEAAEAEAYNNVERGLQHDN